MTRAISRLRWLVLAGFAWIVVQNAWLSDDAFITFRTVDNWVEGYGLRWNVSERVQTFTNPLWLFLLTPLRAITGDLVYSSLAMSWLLSVATLALLLWVSRPRPEVGWAIALVAITSRAYVDYSTSGLENPLGHALIVLFFVFVQRARRLGLMEIGLLASLLALHRLDIFLLALPVLAWRLWQERSWRAVGSLALGMAPLAAWELFSLLYYGFPFPNTAYAKLGSGIGALELMAQGVRYLRNSLTFDPVTLPAIVAGITLGLRGDGRSRTLAAGIVLYLVYVVRVGGDFMSGRFLSTPLAASLALAALAAERVSRRAAAGAIAVALATLLIGHSPVRTGPHHYDAIAREDLADDAEITDERGFYFPATNPLWGRAHPFPDHPWADWGRSFRAAGHYGYALGSEMGMRGFYAGPGLHMIDRFGLVDPLVARLPAVNRDDWRIGHFRRRLPDGYYDSLRLGERKIADPNVLRYYDMLWLITRGPLLNRMRLAAIVRMNLGRYDSLLENTH